MKNFNFKRFFVCLILMLAVVFPSVKTLNVSAETNYRYKLSENTQVAKDIAEEGTVLLKNSGALPLKPTDKVAGLGSAQDYSQIFGGGGSGWVNAVETVNYRDGLYNAVKNGLITSYSPIGNASQAAGFDKALYFISRSTTEGADISRTDYHLNSVEKNDITSLIAICGKENVIVILNVGTVIDTTWLISSGVGAIVLAYLGGEQAGNALASVLTGEVNPSGKLVDTWAKNYDYYPSSNASGIGTFAGDKSTYYSEDVYVGYRYFATFDPNYKKVNYEFGYGLSYTQFVMSNYNVSLNEGKFNVNVDVTNVGNVAGKEVVQVYFEAPVGVMGAPKFELAGFAKTNLLNPQEKQTVQITFDLADFSRYDDLGKISKNSWVIERGDYRLYIGNSIKNATMGGAKYTYEQTENSIIEKTGALRETDLPYRLLSDGTYEQLSETEIDNLETVHTINSVGATVVQAEDYDTIIDTATSEIYYIGADIGFGMGNLNIAGRGLSYKLNVEEAGEYKIAFNMASAWNGQRDMFELFVNGVNQNVNVDMDATHTDSDGRWFTCIYLKSDSFTVNLPQGNVELRMIGNGTNFMNFDSFVIYNSKVTSEKVTTIEAENYYSSSLGTEMIADGTATRRSNKAGTTYTYNLDVQTAGKYYLSLSASNIMGAQTDVLAVYVDGVEQTGAIDLMRTAASGDVLESNYHTFTKTNAMAVDLPAGKVTLKLQTKNTAICCIDKFYLVPEDKYNAEEESTFVDNTNEFKYVANTAGKTLPTLITYEDVYEDNSLVDEFVSQLSIEELSRLLGLDISQNSIDTGTGGVGGMSINKKYKIPSVFTSDGPAGIRYGGNGALYATWFPCMTMLASTWNLQLAQEFGKGLAQEAVLGGVGVWLAPGLNIHRNPLCGRNFEYFSEDPLVTGLFGATITKTVQTYNVSVCIKHFVANEQETNRFGNNSCVSERALREIYLKAFEIVVRTADPMAVMSSYNMVNGLHVASSYDLITQTLKEEWGFNGVVFSDWSPHMGHISLVLSGNTFKSANPEYDTIIKAYKSGILTREDFEKNAIDVINYLIRTNAGGQQTTMISSTEATAITYLNLTRAISNDVGSTEYYRFFIEESGYFKIDLTESIGDVYMHVGEIDLNTNKAVWLEKGLYEFAVKLDEGEEFGGIVFEISSKPSEEPEDSEVSEEPKDSEVSEVISGSESGVQVKGCGSSVTSIYLVGFIFVALYFVNKKRKSNV